MEGQSSKISSAVVLQSLRPPDLNRSGYTGLKCPSSPSMVTFRPVKLNTHIP